LGELACRVTFFDHSGEIAGTLLPACDLGHDLSFSVIVTAIVILAPIVISAARRSLSRNLSKPLRRAASPIGRRPLSVRADSMSALSVASAAIDDFSACPRSDMTKAIDSQSPLWTRCCGAAVPMMARLPELTNVPGLTYVLVAVALAIIYLLPRVTTIILPTALAAIVGLTASLLDEMTDKPSNKRRETVGQGIANFVTGFLGGMGGCAIIGQINDHYAGGRVDAVASRRSRRDWPCSS